MIRRIITLLMVPFLFCTSTWANQEYNITLEKRDSSRTIDLSYAIITLRLVEYENYHRVLFSIENTTTSEAILLFKSEKDEKSLKKNKPKIEFVKRYPGSVRQVFGCKELNQPITPVIPESKMIMFGIDVSPTYITELKLPIYLASYNPKKLDKKGAYDIDYKILSEDIINFNIGIKSWNEADTAYVSTKKTVEDFLKWVDDAKFCDNLKHEPPLEDQQKPYLEKKDSLVNVILTTFGNHPEWYSTDLPKIKYSELLVELNEVDLNMHTIDCGKHNLTHKSNPCSYCSLSAQQIYHQLDDIYQQLRGGKLTKDSALKKAQGLYNCYQRHNKRKKDSSYTDKISKFYSRIIDYTK